MTAHFEHSGSSERLDVALARHLGSSRANAQRAIKAGQVLVNGLPGKAHTLVGPGTAVTINEAPKTQTKTETFLTPPLNILYEDADVIVVNKPSGLLVHPTLASREPTLMDQVIAHYPKVKGVGSDQRRSGVVHRLDKEASGVLIFAKHDKALQHLKDQFKQRLTDKHYVALVQGKMLANNGSIDFPIARSANRGRMAARPKSQTGKEALTHYQVIQHFTTSTLVDVEIYTGRTHQIRAHLFALGHPLVGDKLYTRKGLKPTTLNRLFLHAKELSLTLPSGEKQTFSCPLPQELQDFLANLKTIR